MILASERCQTSSVTQILPATRGLQVNNVNPLNAIKMHLKCHKLKFSDDLYLLTSTNAILEANSVDPDQQQFIMCLHCLTQRLLKHFRRGYNDKRFKDKIN